MKTLLYILMLTTCFTTIAQDSSYCYNSGLASSGIEGPVPSNTDIKQSASLILMPNVMSEKEVMIVLKEKKNASINKLLTKLKLTGNLQPIGFAAIPAGIIGALNLADVNKTQRQQSVGLGLIALGTVCLSSSIYFNIERKKNYKKAIQIYNQLYN